VPASESGAPVASHRARRARPGWCDKTHIHAHNLKDAEDQDLTDERIAEMDPQNWAAWLHSREVYIDAETSEPVDEDGIDFDTA